jgi:hypothetical protein
MDADRIWIIKASIVLLGLSFAFFVVGRPLFGFPMLYDEVIRVLQLIFPVFLGYLGLGASYVTGQKNAMREPDYGSRADTKLARLMLRAPIYLVSGGLGVLIIAFWTSNLPHATAGAGMSLDSFCWFLSAILGVLAASSGLLVTRLFDGQRRSRGGTL